MFTYFLGVKGRDVSYEEAIQGLIVGWLWRLVARGRDVQFRGPVSGGRSLLFGCVFLRDLCLFFIQSVL